MSVAAILLLVSLNFVWGLAAAAFFAQKLRDPSRGKGALMMALLLLGAPAALVVRPFRQPGGGPMQIPMEAEQCQS